MFYKELFCNKMDFQIKNIKSNLESDKSDQSEIVMKSLLESKVFYPLEFKDASQELLNRLKLQLDKSFLIESNGVARSRLKISKVISSRIRSRSRQRVSSSGSLNRTDKSWENNVEFANVIIEVIMNNLETLPSNFLNDPNLEKESKKILDDLKVFKTAKERKEYLEKNKLNVIGEALKNILSKIGGLVPLRISSEVELLKSLMNVRDNKACKRKSHIIAVQILLLNIPEMNRTLLKSIIELYKKLMKHKTVKINNEQLYDLLNISLFNGENNYNKLQLSKDFIHLSHRIFQCPSELNDIIGSKLKSKINSKQPALLNNCQEPTTNQIVKQNNNIQSEMVSVEGPIPDSTYDNGNIRDSLFNDSALLSIRSITILASGTGKISLSPKDNTTTLRPLIKKRCSILITAKEVILKVISPFKTK